jgi:hypothetical protein
MNPIKQKTLSAGMAAGLNPERPAPVFIFGEGGRPECKKL